MKLRLTRRDSGEYEIRDVDHNITVDTSLNPYWINEILLNKTFEILDFEPESQEIISSLI